MTVWCSITWFSTLPSVYLVSSRRDGRLDRLADGDPQAARESGSAARICRPACGLRRRAGRDLAAPDVHHRTAVGLLLVADLDHVDLALDVEHLAGERQGTAPLAGAGLGRQPVDALLLVVVGLGDGRVRLVAARRAVALVLEVDPWPASSAPAPGSSPGPAAWAARWPSTSRISSGISIHRSWLTSCLISSIGKDRRQIVRADRLLGARVQHRRQRFGQVGLQVVPRRRKVFLAQHDPLGIHRFVFPFGTVRREAATTCQPRIPPVRRDP